MELLVTTIVIAVLILSGFILHVVLSRGANAERKVHQVTKSDQKAVDDLNNLL